MRLAHAAERTVFGVGLLAIAYVAVVWIVEATPLLPRLKGWL